MLDTPRKAWSGVTWPSPAFRSSMIGRATSMAIEKPRFWASATMAVFMPTTWPAALTSGPPELPGLMAASVWMRPSSVTPSAVEVAVLGRHDPAGDGRLAAEVEGVADGDHLVADLEVVGRAELGGHEVVDVLHLDQGEVVVGGAADQRGRVLAAVGEHDGDVADAADHVGVGEHEPVGAEDDAGAGALEEALRAGAPLVSMVTTDGCTLARIAWMSRAPSLVVTGVSDGPVDRGRRCRRRGRR